MTNFKIIFLFILLNILCGCSKPKEQEYLIPRDIIANELDSFVISNGKSDSIYEIYIDKISPWEYDLLIFSGKYSLIESANPIGKTKIDGVVFHIYSGIENYFMSYKDTSHIDESPTNKGAPAGNYWVIHDSAGVRTKNIVDFPFAYNQLPHRIKKIPFTAPIVK